MYDNALVKALKQMSAAKKPPVEALRISYPEPVHGFFQIGTPGPELYMIMIARKNIGKNVILKTLSHLLDRI